MTLQALLVSKDDETSALLGSVLCEFGLGVQCCGYLDAICRVTEQKFDAVIVDYDDPHSAALVLQNVQADFCSASSGQPSRCHSFTQARTSPRFPGSRTSAG